jgi:membrane fusion protein, hemolysin D
MLRLLHSRNSEPRLLPAAEGRGVERAFLPAALEIVETPASPTIRFTALAISAVFAAALVWSWIGHVDIIATAPGKIIALARTKVVQTEEIGVVRTIAVADGEHVKVGQLLVMLDPTTVRADRTRALHEQEQARLDIARLEGLAGRTPGDPFAGIRVTNPADLAAAESRMLAERAAEAAKLAAAEANLAGRNADLAGVQSGIAKINAELPLLHAQAVIRSKSVQHGFGSQLQYLQTEQQLKGLESDLPVEHDHLAQASAAVQAAERERAKVIADFSSSVFSQLADAEQRLAAASDALAKADRALQLTRLTAPIGGIVEGLAVHTTGAVVTPAEQLMAIVPEAGGLAVDAVVENRDRGFIRPGQTAAIKVSTFPFTRYGLLHGTVERVSTDAVVAEQPGASPTFGSVSASEAPGALTTPSRLVYTARVSLDRTSMNIDGRRTPLLPGMAVTVEVKTGRRRVLDYLLAPLSQALNDSMHER